MSASPHTMVAAMQQVDTDVVVLIVVSTATVMLAASLFSIYLGRRTATSEDWTVGGHNLPTYVIVGTQYATAMGGGVLVGLVGVGYTSGWSVITYGLWPCIGLLVFTFFDRPRSPRRAGARRRSAGADSGCGSGFGLRSRWTRFLERRPYPIEARARR